jgi:hypothetical protein
MLRILLGHGRIKKMTPTPAEAERIVSDMAMSTLQKMTSCPLIGVSSCFEDWGRTESPTTLYLWEVKAVPLRGGNFNTASRPGY